MSHSRCKNGDNQLYLPWMKFSANMSRITSARNPQLNWRLNRYGKDRLNIFCSFDIETHSVRIVSFNHCVGFLKVEIFLDLISSSHWFSRNDRKIVNLLICTQNKGNLNVKIGNSPKWITGKYYYTSENRSMEQVGCRFVQGRRWQRFIWTRDFNWTLPRIRSGMPLEILYLYERYIR